MQIITGLLGIFGKKFVINLALDILWRSLGKIATDAMQYVREAEEHPEWSAAQKADYVRRALVVKYGDIKQWKWIISFVIELAVGKLKDEKGIQKSAAILKVG